MGARENLLQKIHTYLPLLRDHTAPGHQVQSCMIAVSDKNSKWQNPSFVKAQDFFKKKENEHRKKKKLEGKILQWCGWCFPVVVEVEFISVLPKLSLINMVYFYREKINFNGVKFKATYRYVSKGWLWSWNHSCLRGIEPPFIFLATLSLQDFSFLTGDRIQAVKFQNPNH